MFLITSIHDSRKIQIFFLITGEIIFVANNFQRIYQLHRILTSDHLSVSHKDIEEQVECSRATVTRTIKALRDYFNAPVVYDRERRLLLR
ncbi:HTH domain-containing protein [Nitrosomonas marina]|uniref:HTH domain-containing protein n=1 Tax=Nitrosomonas marina TaxID=917 RepID=UPI000B87D44F